MSVYIASSDILTRSPQHSLVRTFRHFRQDLHQRPTYAQARRYHSHEACRLDRLGQRAALAHHCSIRDSHLLALSQRQDHAHRSRDCLGEMRHGCHGRERRDDTGCWWSELDVGNHGPRAGGGIDFWLSNSEKSRRRFVMVDVMRYDTLVI